MSLDPAVVSAVSGISGVILGGLIATIKDLWLASSKEKADRIYLSIMVGAELSRYFAQCLHVALDDGRGTDPWSDFDHEERSPRVSIPDFKPMELKVEWKVLPAQLLHDILDIPHEADRIETSIAYVAQFDDDVPEHLEYFWKRRELWGHMGLRVLDIADRLRELSGLPAPPIVDGDWSIRDELREAIEKVEVERKKREARLAAIQAKRAKINVDTSDQT